MRVATEAAAAALATAALVMPVACASRPGPVAAPSASVLPAPSLRGDAPTRLQEVLGIANANESSSVTVQGEMEIEVGEQSLGTWRLSLLVSRAGGMRLVAGDGDDGFEMASDGATVWIRPSGGALIRRDAASAGMMIPDRPWTLLDPLVLADALLPRPLPDPAGGDDLLTLEFRPRETVVDWLRRSSLGDWHLVRRVAVDSRGLNWVESFGTTGQLIARVEYAGPWLAAGVASGVRIIDSGMQIQLRTQHARSSPTVSADTFRLH